jgi:hypothetical protein
MLFLKAEFSNLIILIESTTISKDPSADPSTRFSQRVSRPPHDVISHNEAAVSFKVRRLTHKVLEGHTLPKSNDYFDETLQEEAKQVRSSSVGSMKVDSNAELSFEEPKAQQSPNPDPLTAASSFEEKRRAMTMNQEEENIFQDMLLYKRKPTKLQQIEEVDHESFISVE